ncbi:phosphomannomutase [Luteibacter rhizovicinus]|uniref:phosphomannomutase n=1 Tax=Luteibacter rhizovicinus TaxID=242606 RepID=A0A4R3YP41_9GAMM|nr:phosphomannomutase/phosphoglucomutase [Luteibacter rhizovicinus]TCV92673.1 phosphomannomutase [Luteibacter rhizovicinus]
MAGKAGGAGKGIRIDVAGLLPLVGATLLIAGGLFCVWQTWLIADEADAAERVRSAQRQAVHDIGEVIAARHAQVAKAAADPVLASIIDDHGAAAQRLKQLLPDSKEIEVYSGGLDEVVRANYREFGYAKAAQLMAALGSDEQSPVQSFLVGTERELSVVEPIGGPGAVRAYVWLQYPFDSVHTRFESIQPASGRIELRQGEGGSNLQLLTKGSTSPTLEDQGQRIPGSALYIYAALPKAFIVLPHSWPLTLVLALAGLAGGIALLWMRSRPRQVVVAEPEDMLVADVVREPPRLATPVRVLESPKAREPETVTVDPSIFRAYDIRGIVGTNLNAGVARLIGQAVGSLMREQGLSEIVIGRDGRLSGPELAGALSEGLRAAGVDVIDLGAVPTPLVYFATFKFNTGCGVVVTGSHNPPDYNGFKIVVGGQTLSEGAIQDIYKRIDEKRLDNSGGGGLRTQDIVGDYVERIASDVSAEGRLKVVVDCGNGVAGDVAPRVLEAIGCEVIPLYCDVDGTFPNHHPDPSDPHNLQDLIVSVQKTGADIGVAFDGDGDRLGVVTRSGEIVYADRLLMLFAQDVLSRNPGATIIYDVKSTGHLRKLVQDSAGVPLMWRTGHSLIKAKMRETGAALAGEMSGHFFFADNNRWYGFDDGIYAAARLLEIVGRDVDAGGTSDEIFETLPQSLSTPELKVAMAEGVSHRFVEDLRAKASFGDARLTTIDGIRADWSDGWGLVRASNTTPALVLRFEADNGKALERIKEVFRQQIHAMDPSLTLPF